MPLFAPSKLPAHIKLHLSAIRKDQFYYVSQVDGVPTEILLILGDAIQNLRTALDHLAQQLYLVGTGSSDLATDTSFPIADTVSIHQSLLRKSVKGMRREAVDAICALEPYKDAKGHQFWVLHKLNNIDKHRALVAVESYFGAYNASAHLLGGDDLPAWLQGIELIELPPLFIKPADNLCPLKVGDELLIGAPDAKFNPKIEFSLGVALHEPDVIEPGPMLEIVQRLADVVSDTVKAFKPYLA